MAFHGVAETGRLPELAITVDLYVGELAIVLGEIMKPTQYFCHPAMVGLIHQETGQRYQGRPFETVSAPLSTSTSAGVNKRDVTGLLPRVQTR